MTADDRSPPQDEGGWRRADESAAAVDGQSSVVYELEPEALTQLAD
jgi:hypothetical protein